VKFQNREAIFYVMAACAGFELLFFLWLCTLELPTFMEFVSSPDTQSYTRIALELVQNSILIASPRTLGYPLLLSLGYLIGGVNYGMHIVIAVQLILNMVFTWICWKLLLRMAPAAGTSFRIMVTLVFFWAGLGMAHNVLTDFLAAFFFAVFFFGMLFWRSPMSVILSGTSLALATLIRPTFTFVPMLLPVAAYFIGWFTAKVPRSHLVAWVVFSLGATIISVGYQYSSDGYIGPSSLVTLNIATTLHYSTQKPIKKMDYGIYYGIFKKRIESRAGRPYFTLSRSEVEKYAVQIFLGELISQPREIMLTLGKTFVKYLFVPIEYSVKKLTNFYTSEQVYFTYIRPILFICCLPIWLLSLSPPMDSREKRGYYFLAMMFLLYLAGISSIVYGQGERIRFPMLVFILPVMTWNAYTVGDYLSRWRRKEERGL